METPLTYDQALDLYFDAPDAYESVYLGQKLQPNSHISTRTDADDGWYLRNITVFLAKVLDTGAVIPFIDPCADDYLQALTEASRGTPAEA